MARIAFQAAEANYDSTPVNVTLVLDASGSMSTDTGWKSPARQPIASGAASATVTASPSSTSAQKSYASTQ